MLNYRIVLRSIGALLLLESFFLFLSMLVAINYKGHDWLPLLITSVITCFTGIVILRSTKKIDPKIGKREAYLIVSLSWIIFSIFGALPFVIYKDISNYTDAFFETMSGFTTTGASILNDIEAMPSGLLFWRSLTQWLGGMGFIVMSVAIMPLLGIGGMQLFAAEVPGPTADKIHPRVRETAQRLWGIYISLTLLQTILLQFGGMSFFDAINHAFTTMATGGYSTKQASIAYWNSPYIHYVIIVFMFFAGTNFSLFYYALKGKFSRIIENEEFKYYGAFILCFALVISIFLYFTKDYGIEQSFRNALFQVVSIITTTGYITDDYLSWVPILISLIFVLMFVGGSAGSTGGGVKVVRIVLLLKNSILEFKRLIHPNAVIPVRLNNHAVASQIITNILAFIFFYMLIFAVSTVILTSLGLDFISAAGAAITCLGNIGPGLGSVGPASNFYEVHWLSKWVLSFLMLIGRLELFTVLIIFTPAFWKK